MTAIQAAFPRLKDPVFLVTGVTFFACFAPAIFGLIKAWVTIADAAHGLLIAPVAIWVAWRSGIVSDARPSPWIGATTVLCAVVVNVIGRAAGVETAPRVALLMTLVGLTVCYAGWKQVRAWWLPFVLLLLAIPLPETLIAAITLPLQGVAARFGAELIRWRHVPVIVSGNVIQLPGHTLFVSEACSGLRSLTALVSMAVLVGALFLTRFVSRMAIVLAAVVLAIVVNSLRVFLTAFLVLFVDPRLGEGFMHLSEGYLLFFASLLGLAGVTWLLGLCERRFAPSVGARAAR